MNDALYVQMLECQHHLCSVELGRTLQQQALLMQVVEQLSTRYKRHDQVHVRLGLERVPQTNEERVIDLGHNVSLSLQVRHRVVLYNVLVRHNLQQHHRQHHQQQHHQQQHHHQQ